ncbi:hypothetical protein MMC25_005205 [Agyrium rufum]|nr:hypothetical protein [Agyrium rufum]
MAFLLANLSYYLILPWDSIHDENTIAVAVGNKTLGTPGRIEFALLVSASCLGSLNINIYTTGRLTVASAQHGYVPTFLVMPQEKQARHPEDVGSGSVLSKLTQWLSMRLAASSGPNNGWDAPVKAMVFNAFLAAIFIFLGTFGGLVSFIGLTEYLFYFLTVLGSLILRFTQPRLVRPYQPHIIFPVVFCCVSFFLVLRGLLYSPMHGVLLVALIGLGVLSQLYKHKYFEIWLTKKRHPSDASSLVPLEELSTRRIS